MDCEKLLLYTHIGQRERECIHNYGEFMMSRKKIYFALVMIWIPVLFASVTDPDKYLTLSLVSPVYSAEDCPPLVISGLESHCASLVKGWTRWVIDDRNEDACPVLVQNPLKIPRSSGLQITRSKGYDGIMSIIVRVVGGGLSKAQNQSCELNFSDRSDSFSLDVMSLSGTPWQAGGTIYRKAASIKLSDIVFSPI